MLKQHRQIEYMLLAAVLLLAAYLRMGQPGIVEYKRDEANLSQLALDFVHTGDLPLLGIGSSVGVPNAPVNVYILAIPYLFSSNPLHATQFIGFMNVIAVGVTYLIARRYTNGWIALSVALMLAVNPWHVVFSRKIWAQNMLPLFVVLSVWTGLLGFVERKRWAQVAHLPLLVLTGQIHYGAFVMIPSTLYLLWQGRQHLSRAFWLSIGAAIVFTLPYAIGAMQVGLDGFQIAESGERPELRLTFEAVRSAALLIAGTEIHALAGPQQFQAYLAAVPDVYPLLGVVAWMVLLSVVYLVVKHRKRRNPIVVTLLLWLIFPVTVFSVTWTPFFIHYLIPIFPAAFLMLGFAVHDLHKPSINRVVFPLIAVIVVFQGWLLLALLDFVDDRYTPDGFGTPLHYLLDVREFILEHDVDQVLADVGGQALIFDDEPTLWNTLLYDKRDVRFQDHRTEVYPAAPVVYLTNSCDETGQVFHLRDGEGCYTVSVRMPSDFPGDDELNPLDDSWYLANGVTILGYQWDGLCLSLAWDITALTDRDYSFAVQFVNAAGTQIAAADALSWLGRYWRPGDRVVRTFCLPEQNPGVAAVRIGMYVYDGMTFDNMDFLDAAGNPAGQMREIALR